MTSDVDLLRDTDLLYPEHDRNSCSDESPINVEAAGSHGCERCTAIALARGEASEARAERLAEALRKYGQHDDTCEVNKPGHNRCTCGFSAAIQDKEEGK